MSVRTRTRQTKMFKLFSKNASFFCGCDNDDCRVSKGEIFFCPICIKGFTIDSIFDQALTREHMFPKRLKGRDITLTCKQCNNTIGSKIQSHKTNAVNRLEADYETVRYSYRGIDGTVCSKMSIDGPNKFLLEVDERRSNPYALQEFERKVHQPKFDLALENLTFLETHKYKPFLADLTYLYFAYLLLFHNFGYQWVYSNIAIKIRSQLIKPNQTIYPPLIYKPDELAGEQNKYNKTKGYIQIIRGIDNLLCFLVRTPCLQYFENQRKSVLIPLQGNEDDYLQYRIDKREFSINILESLPSTHEKLVKPLSKSIVSEVLKPYT